MRFFLLTIGDFEDETWSIQSKLAVKGLRAVRGEILALDAGRSRLRGRGLNDEG
jgi:hypothetical protein